MEKGAAARSASRTNTPASARLDASGEAKDPSFFAAEHPRHCCPGALSSSARPESSKAPKGSSKTLAPHAQVVLLTCRHSQRRFFGALIIHDPLRVRSSTTSNAGRTNLVRQHCASRQKIKPANVLVGSIPDPTLLAAASTTLLVRASRNFTSPSLSDEEVRLDGRAQLKSPGGARSRSSPEIAPSRRRTSSISTSLTGRQEWRRSSTSEASTKKSMSRKMTPFALPSKNSSNSTRAKQYPVSTADPCVKRLGPLPGPTQNR